MRLLLLFALPSSSLAHERIELPVEPEPNTWVDAAVPMPGLAGFERVAMLEAGVLCGTRRGTSPICAAESRYMPFATPYEALDDVAKLQALNYGHCVLYGSGDLHCERDEPHSPPKVESPRSWRRVAAGVTDMAMSATAGGTALVYGLREDGTVVVLVPPLDGERVPEPVVVAAGADAIASTGGGVCVRTGSSVRCSGEDPLSAVVTADVAPVRTLFYGQVLLHEDGRYTGWPPGPFPERARFTDYAPQAGCFLTTEGAIECGGMGADRIETSARALHFAPRGDALCAQLADDSTACFGPFLDAIRRLSDRAR